MRQPQLISSLLLLSLPLLTQSFLHLKPLPVHHQPSFSLATRTHTTTQNLLFPSSPPSCLMPLKMADSYLDAMQPQRNKKAPAVEWSALGKWVLATGLQFASIVAFMYGMEKAFAKFEVAKQTSLWIVRAFFAFMSLRSRVFSILDNSRPTVAQEERKRKQKRRPSWMPPAKAFPIIWISIGVLRTIASSLIYETTNTLLHPAIYALFLHLSIGDTWNTITNVEDRQGVSVPGVFCVWLSVINAVREYNLVLPLAAKVLAPSAVWITVANVLVFSIWRLNGSEPIYPFRKRRE